MGLQSKEVEDTNTNMLDFSARPMDLLVTMARLEMVQAYYCCSFSTSLKSSVAIWGTISVSIIVMKLL